MSHQRIAAMIREHAAHCEIWDDTSAGLVCPVDGALVYPAEEYPPTEYMRSGNHSVNGLEGLVHVMLVKEAIASTALDRDQTHVVGEVVSDGDA